MKRYQQVLSAGLIGLATIVSATASFTNTSLAQTTQPNPSEFSQFRQRLLNAVQRADAPFVRTIVTPQTQWSYGGTLNLDSYKIENNQSKFWDHLDKAVSQGCSVDSQARVPNKEVGSSVWVCPDLTQVQRSIQPNRPRFGNLGVIGKDVNVRAEAGMRGRVISTVSNDYVAFDLDTYNRLPASTRQSIERDPVNSWTPIRLRNGQRGWIANRYLYDEEKDYRASFVRTSGQWRLRYFLPGNGN